MAVKELINLISNASFDSSCLRIRIFDKYHKFIEICETKENVEQLKTKDDDVLAINCWTDYVDAPVLDLDTDTEVK